MQAESPYLTTLIGLPDSNNSLLSSREHRLGQQPTYKQECHHPQQYARELLKALVHARTYADQHPRQVPLITINSWNEWTETSYLQPDNVNGYGYLEAVKSVYADSLQAKDK